MGKVSKYGVGLAWKTRMETHDVGVGVAKGDKIFYLAWCRASSEG